MKYAALLTNLSEDIDAWEKMSPDEAQAARAQEIPKWEALMGEFGPSGAIGFGAELDSPSTAKTVRVRDGETIVTDGPFAETKEQLGAVPHGVRPMAVRDRFRVVRRAGGRDHR